MTDDILKAAIEETAKRFVYDRVDVKVNSTPYKAITYYEIELSYGDFHTTYMLHNQHITSRGYIMRVVSDLCINLARHYGKERDFFFKRSDINDEEE